ncbi:MAG: 23S rRNA (uracil(1939)-C(5))-methyltransferase RlmD [Proteobacteria bacterium]|nr:23S rRNA (uracil(1939)-C(5))-methyltransferase RlmD [Pseudomonadota bacterium]
MALPGEGATQAPLLIEIIDIALPNNYGVAKIEGLVVFVPEGIIGDLVKVKILRQEKKTAYGEIFELVAPSLFRVIPRCSHFGPCGGCTLQNLSYEKQLELKENYLLQTLKRIGGLDTEKIRFFPITPSPDIYYYRNKLELAFGESEGRATIGLRERVSPFKKYQGNVVPIERCLISSQVTEKIIPPFINFARKHGLAAYNPFTGQGFLRHLFLRESKSSNELMAIIETTKGDMPDLMPLWQLLTTLVPEIKSFYRIINNIPGDNFHSGKLIHIAGKSYIEETLNGLKFRVFPESFFQPNTKAAEILYKKIIELADLKADEKVLGLYCGAGPIEISLAGYAKEVTGIDSLQANIINAHENCKLNKVKNCFFHTGKVETILGKINLDKTDLLIMDPPRGGISNDGLKHIARINPKKIGYISCNPSTLARDLKDITTHGYSITGITPFDFFPHTPHIETLVVLERL